MKGRRLVRKCTTANEQEYTGAYKTMVKQYIFNSLSLHAKLPSNFTPFPSDSLPHFLRVFPPLGVTPVCFCFCCLFCAACVAATVALVVWVLVVVVVSHGFIYYYVCVGMCVSVDDYYYLCEGMCVCVDDDDECVGEGTNDTSLSTLE